jgi:flagellar motility protein MotE (MotC chaperone)
MFRLLPYLIIFLSVNFTLRAFNIVTDQKTIALIAELQAEEKAETNNNEKKDPPADFKRNPDENEESPKKNDSSSNPEPGEPKDTPIEDSEKESSDEGWQPIIQASENVKQNISEEEIKLLQELAKRRGELDNREKEMAFRENSLLMIEKSLEAKILQLNELQKKVAEILQEYDKREQQKTISLVRIYENMKPKDAARIFDELQMSILVEVADNMKEAKLAPILAQMDSNRAKELTVAIAHRRRLNLN